MGLVAPQGACSYPRALFRFFDSSGLAPFAADNPPVHACVIFNPVAKGDKARAFRKSLDTIASQCALKATAAPGDARRLAAAAIEEGFEIIVAAGGDGTLNEVLNGFGDVPNGFSRAALAVLPLGTVNVFARELKIPLRPEPAWKALCNGREIRADLPWIEYTANGRTERHYFAQMAGAGLDARAIELVSWPLKKRIGPLAYVAAGLKALSEKAPRITAVNGENNLTGELVLIGNGERYGGNYRVFRGANLQDGKLTVCVFPKVGWGTLARCGFPLLARGELPEATVRRFRTDSLTLTAESPAAFEVDGELIGHLPAKFSVAPGGLRLRVP